MTQNERLQELLHTLLAEPQAPQADIPRDIESQKQLLRALMNIRPPRPVNERFLRIQDDYLQEELRHMPITDAMTLPVIDPHYDMSLWQCYSNLNHTLAAYTTPPATGVLPLCTRLRRVRRNNPPWRSL